MRGTGHFPAIEIKKKNHWKNFMLMHEGGKATEIANWHINVAKFLSAHVQRVFLACKIPEKI